MIIFLTSYSEVYTRQKNYQLNVIKLRNIALDLLFIKNNKVTSHILENNDGIVNPISYFIHACSGETNTLFLNVRRSMRKNNKAQ
jgi:hypothetical protein